MDFFIDHSLKAEAPLVIFQEGKSIHRAVLYRESIQGFLQELQAPSKKRIPMRWSDTTLALLRANGELHLQIHNNMDILLMEGPISLKDKRH